MGVVRVGLTHKKKMYNYVSDEKLEDAKIIGGNPNGIISFNQTPHKWATSLYRAMLARSWFAEQINISKDKLNYGKLSPDIKKAYDLYLAQLITNDSVQTNQLMDSINQYITSPVVNACLARQAFEESLHSFSYSVMAEDICQDTERIYELWKHDDELALKNKAVADMYNLLYTGEEAVVDAELLLAFAANQILEELVFPSGFAFFYSIEDQMTGSAEMIAEIQKDETLSHVPLFMKIFRTTVTERFQGVVPDYIVAKISEMVRIMADAEIRWGTYATKGIPGFTEHTISALVKSQANSVCKNLGIPLLYEISKKPEDNPLGKLLKDRLRGGEMETKTLFFEGNPVDYSKGTMDMDLSAL